MLSYEDAKAAEGATFTIRAGTGAALPLTLMEVRTSDPYGVPPGFRRPLSLRFRGTPGVLCPQGTYLLENDRVGVLEVFVVPIGHDAAAGEFIYEVVFN